MSGVVVRDVTSHRLVNQDGWLYLVLQSSQCRLLIEFDRGFNVSASVISRSSNEDDVRKLV